MKLNILLYLLILTTSACQTKQSNTVRIAVAANMQHPVQALVEHFESKHPIQVESSSSSSGILATQIRHGAPYDVFISANMMYPDLLHQEGLTISAPITYAYGTLILWTLNDQIDLNQGFKACLLSNNVERIAIANPETAPYGIAAMEVLENTELFGKLQSKLIKGESISQVNQYTQSNSVEVGITSKSVLYTPNLSNKGRSLDIDSKYYTPISQGIVLLKTDDENRRKNASLFYDFMLSEDAALILSKYGYQVN
ncbi:MAG: molybdate ABC transporter substrate-binding protein [Reichenbachiella sp.]